VDIISRLREKTDRTIRTHLDSMRKESERQHREILAAVAAGDLEASVAALKKHLDYTSNDLQSWMRSEQDLHEKKRTRPTYRPLHR
jgi:DNA-binding GntR family transcriptional regulator